MLRKICPAETLLWNLKEFFLRDTKPEELSEWVIIFTQKTLDNFSSTSDQQTPIILANQVCGSYTTTWEDELARDPDTPLVYVSV